MENAELNLIILVLFDLLIENKKCIKFGEYTKSIGIIIRCIIKCGKLINSIE